MNLTLSHEKINISYIMFMNHSRKFEVNRIEFGCFVRHFEICTAYPYYFLYEWDAISHIMISRVNLSIEGINWFSKLDPEEKEVFMVSTSEITGLDGRNGNSLNTSRNRQRAILFVMAAPLFAMVVVFNYFPL